MKHTNALASMFDWLGEALERFNPSAFRFLAAVLPYLTPIPVAWLTSQSSAQFLKFTPNVSFVFVFALEGIGLWFTTMLVDAVVDWVRSKNWKSFFPALMLGVTVLIYVSILVNLNVTLEQASGAVNPYLSRVITFLCFLPLITGIGNGYYKLKLDYKTQTEISKQRQEEMQERIRKENEEKEAQIRREKREERLERLRIKRGISGSNNGSSGSASGSNNGNRFTSRNTNGSSGSNNGNSRIGRPPLHQERVFSYLEEQFRNTGGIPTFTEVASKLKLPQSTASRLRNNWINGKK